MYTGPPYYLLPLCSGKIAKFINPANIICFYIELFGISTIYRTLIYIALTILSVTELYRLLIKSLS